MKKGKFKATIYLICFTVLVTVGIQVYRNVQNYNLNKERFINDIQVALDNSVESYYATLAKNDLIILSADDIVSSGGASVKSVFNGKMDFTWKNDTFHTKKHKGASHFDFQFSDTTPPKNTFSINSIRITTDTIPDLSGFYSTSATGIGKFGGPTKGDSVTIRRIEDLTKKVMISLIRDSIDFESLNKGLKKELGRKQLALDYTLKHFKNDSIKGEYGTEKDAQYSLATFSNSTFLPRGQKLKMEFPNSSLIILRRGLADMLISLLISVAVIGSLLYLYRIINQQKQLAEIKNDLISNITHEFKTPIATVHSALEGIGNFNQENDPVKTAKYLDISAQQLKKLNLMVEKLLETATLDSEALNLRKEPVNLSQLLHTLIEKYKMVAREKCIKFTEQIKDSIIEADPFHLENALSNLIDNAVKYGGDEIIVSLAQSNGYMQVIVQDNGGFIEKSQRERVFDKFYRIPKGNQHDVKGFGIGLYYTKTIIEKHGGTINLVVKPQLTSFEVAI